MSTALRLGLSAILLLGCQSRGDAGATPEVLASSHAHDAAPRVVAPSEVALTSDALERVTSLYISSRHSGVTLEKSGDGWVSVFAGRCPVASARVEAALAHFTQLRARPTTARVESGADFRTKLVVYEQKQKLLKLAIGPATEQGVLVQLDDGTSRELLGYRAELFPAESAAWCGK